MMSILAFGLGCNFRKSESSVITVSPEREASSTIRPLLDPGPKASSTVFASNPFFLSS